MPIASSKERVERRQDPGDAAGRALGPLRVRCLASKQPRARRLLGAIRLPVFLLTGLGTTALSSAAPPPPPNDSWARAALVVAIGAFGAGEDQQAAEIGLRLRRGGKRWLQPLAGGMVTSAGAVNAYVGLSARVQAVGGVGFRFSFAPGYYAKGGAKDLGYPIEFRSALEVGVELGGQRSIGIEYAHLSNGGLAQRNPGVESLVIVLALPVGRRGRSARP